MRIVSTWYYEQDSREGGEYAQVRGDSSSEGFRDVYRRCVGVFFATARAANESASLRLYLNRPWDPDASEVARTVHGQLGALGVELHVVPYAFAPPKAWPNAWRNQFFVFDVLADLASRTSPSDLVLVLDSDVIWSGSPSTEAMWEALDRQGVLTLDVGYSPGININGITREQLSSIASRYRGKPFDRLLSYYGGEFIALRGDINHAVTAKSRQVWSRVVHDFQAGEQTFPEEAHMYSCLVAMLEVPTPVGGNAFVKRIWTQVGKYRDVEAEDAHLPLWHLPAEKRYGLRRVFRRIDQDGRLKSIGVSRLARSLGIPSNWPLKAVKDLTYALLSRVGRFVSKPSSY